MPVLPKERTTQPAEARDSRRLAGEASFTFDRLESCTRSSTPRLTRSPSRLRASHTGPSTQRTFTAGVPLLQSSKVVIGVSHLETTVLSLIEISPPVSALPGIVGGTVPGFESQTTSDRDVLGLTVAEVLHEDLHVPAYSGLLRYLGWAVMVSVSGPGRLSPSNSGAMRSVGSSESTVLCARRWR